MRRNGAERERTGTGTGTGTRTVAGEEGKTEATTGAGTLRSPPATITLAVEPFFSG
jgi:hypothetical protein